MTAPDAPSGPSGGLPPVGGLAEEAAQLLDALAVRLAQVRITVGDHAAAGESATDDQLGHGPETVTSHLQCVGWCPVCRSADLLRGERPEVAGRLVDSAIVVVGALRSLLPAAGGTVPDESAAGQRSAGQSAPAGPAGRPGGPGGTAPASPGIERIDIR